MELFQKIPSWDAIHPMVVHFPIALLLIAPLFLIIALAVTKVEKPFLIACLILMTTGTIASFIAIATGEASAELADRTPEINLVLEQHQGLAELTRNIFTALTIAFLALIFFQQKLIHVLGKPSTQALFIVFLLVYFGGCLLLANTAHQGGRLVHELGVSCALFR